MYKEIRRDGNHSTWEVVQLICDSDADIPSLPTLTDPSADGKHQPCAPGSTVKVLASKCIYILNNEGEWVLYEDNGSGMSGTLTYKTYDGTTTLQTENILLGGNGTYANTTPRAIDSYYQYTPNGWATTIDGDPDEYAIKNVVGERTVYAAYDKTPRNFSIQFRLPREHYYRPNGYNPATIFENLPYGSMAEYHEWVDENGNPISSQGTDVIFNGWSPELSIVSGSATYTGSYTVPEKEEVEITDSWETIVSKIQSGSHNYHVGNYKDLDLGDKGIVTMELAALNADYEDISFGPVANIFTKDSAKNPVATSWVAKHVLKDTHVINSTGMPANGWLDCEIRSYLNEDIMQSMPVAVRNAIKQVSKTTQHYSSTSSSSNFSVISKDYIWMPSFCEVSYGINSDLGEGFTYYARSFRLPQYRIRTKYGESTAVKYALRSGSAYQRFRAVKDDGSFASYSNEHINPTSATYIVIGFCI